MMEIPKTLSNLVKYRTLVLKPQVDPDIVRHTMEQSFTQHGYNFSQDRLTINKSSKESLFFRYSLEDDAFASLRGGIYAMAPRKDFQKRDLCSYLEVSFQKPERLPHIFSVIEDFVQKSGIEEVFPNDCFGDMPRADKCKLRKIRGRRHFHDLKYGLRADS